MVIDLIHRVPRLDFNGRRPRSPQPCALQPVPKRHLQPAHRHVFSESRHQAATAKIRSATLSKRANSSGTWPLMTYATPSTSPPKSCHTVLTSLSGQGCKSSPQELVKPMRVARSPIQFECVYLNTLRFPGMPPMGTADVVFGRVVAVHIADEAIDINGMVDVLKINP